MMTLNMVGVRAKSDLCHGSQGRRHFAFSGSFVKKDAEC